MIYENVHANLELFRSFSISPGFDSWPKSGLLVQLHNHERRRNKKRRAWSECLSRGEGIVRSISREFSALIIRHCFFESFVVDGFSLNFDLLSERGAFLILLSAEAWHVSKAKRKRRLREILGMAWLRLIIFPSLSWLLIARRAEGCREHLIDDVYQPDLLQKLHSSPIKPAVLRPFRIVT
jgi:hypothetical protein